MGSMKNYQKQGNLRAWGKAVIGVLFTHYFDATVGGPSFWIVYKAGTSLLWWCSSRTVLEAHNMSVFKPWKTWSWGTSAKDQPVQTGKEEKEVHGKNELVKNNMEPFTRVQQNVTHIFLLQFILVIYEHTKILSQQLLQAFIIFYFIYKLNWFFIFVWSLFVSTTTINHKSAQLARKQKVNSKFCFTG